MIDPGPPILGAAFHRLPLAGRTIPNMLRDCAHRFGDRHFASLPGGRLRFSDVVPLAARVAGAFAALDPDAGNPVALLLGNRIEFIATVWGQAWRGGVSVPLNPALVGQRLAHMLSDSGATILVTDAGHLAVVAEIAPSLPALAHIVVIDAMPDTPDLAWSGPAFHHWQAMLDGAAEVASAEPRFDDPAIIMYTSGTTGLSKGVVMPHHQYYCYAAPNVDNHQWAPGDHLYTPMPMCHAQAHLSLLVPGLIAGAEVTIAERFSASGFWEEVASCGATHVSLMGATGNILALQPPGPQDRGHMVRTIACAPPPNDIKGFEARFGVTLLWQAYGMTEGYFNQRQLAQAERARNCIGRPLPLFDVAIIDEQGETLPRDGAAVGEIVVRPRLPAVMTSGYYRNPAATRDAFRDNWFHTGDLASIDPDGFMFLHGRKKDSIRRRGENISAVEVEQEALSHPAVAMAAAFAVPSALGEDDVKLDVVLVEGARLAPVALLEHLRQRLPNFAVPRYVQFRKALPLTPSQRVEKYKLAAEGVLGADYDAGDGGRAGHPK